MGLLETREDLTTRQQSHHASLPAYLKTPGAALAFGSCASDIFIFRNKCFSTRLGQRQRSIHGGGTLEPTHDLRVSPVRLSDRAPCRQSRDLPVHGAHPGGRGRDAVIGTQA